jgi:hypothetical protein
MFSQMNMKKMDKPQVAGPVTAMIVSFHVHAAGPIACVLHKGHANDKKRDPIHALLFTVASTFYSSISSFQS